MTRFALILLIGFLTACSDSGNPNNSKPATPAAPGQGAQSPQTPNQKDGSDGINVPSGQNPLMGNAWCMLIQNNSNLFQNRLDFTTDATFNIRMYEFSNGVRGREEARTEGTYRLDRDSLTLMVSDGRTDYYNVQLTTTDPATGARKLQLTNSSGTELLDPCY